MRTLVLSKNSKGNHTSDLQFKPYRRVSSFVKHLNHLYDTGFSSRFPDEAYHQSKHFQMLSPNKKDKVSCLPKTYALAVKPEMRHNKSIEPRRFAKSVTPSPKRDKTKETIMNFNEFRNLSAHLKADDRKKCHDCRRVVCECIEKTQDRFLKSLLKRKIGKSGVILNRKPAYKKLGCLQREKHRVVLLKTEKMGRVLGYNNVESERTEAKKIKSARANLKSCRKIKAENIEISLSITPVCYSDRRETSKRLPFSAESKIR